MNRGIQSARNINEKPVSMKNQVPWNYIDYNTAKTNAESMYSTDYVQSGLLTGKMWDTTMQWIENDLGKNAVQVDSSNWANYKEITVIGITEYSTDHGITWTKATTKPYDIEALLKTGESDYTKRKNIYDLAGNVAEWINEIFELSPSQRMMRGGACSDKISNRYSDVSFSCSTRY